MTKKLHMIGNAHIDPVWLWRWQEGYQEVKATFRSALDRLAESDDVVFTASSACFYAWVEESDPDMFEEIRARVTEGRWCLAGGWWIEPDCNLPCGESFARQALYGQRWFQDRFGRIARVGFNPDAFGHAATLPQILLRSGLEATCFLRPQRHEMELPAHLFAWEGADGSRLPAFRILFEYLAPGDDLEPHVRRCADELAAAPTDLMCFYGVGNHGGGPTVKNLEQIRALDGANGLPPLVFSSPDRYLDEVIAGRPELPVVRGELQHHARGCYAAHAGIKRWNRRAEAQLMAAERLTELARRVAGARAVEDLSRAWKGVLFNQFHDILAGTSLESAYEDARDLAGEACAIAARAANHAVQSIAWRIGIDPAPGGKPIVVVNPHAWSASMPIELEIGGLKGGEVLVDEDGAEVPYQVIRSGATVVRGRNRIALVAELPALGWRTFRLVPGAAPPPVAADGGPAPAPAPPPPVVIEEGAIALENAALRLEIDRETGCPARLLDRRTGLDLLAGPARAVVYDDPTDTWSHGLTRYEQEVGCFRLDRAVRIEDGPVTTVLRIESSFERSRLVQELVLHADLDRVEVRAELDWREPRRLVKLRFPTALAGARATYEAPYGFVERAADGAEQPGGSWVDLSGTIGGRPAGLGLVNDGPSSFDVHGADLGMTVARSPIYAHHDPLVPDPDGVYRHIDQGPLGFSYALVPHAGSWQDAELLRRAGELGHRPIPLVETYHAGPLPLRASGVRVDGAAVAIAVLKAPEEDGADGGGATGDLVVRCVETSGAGGPARIDLASWGRIIEARFGPLEIKTFRVPRDPAAAIVELDLIERPI